MKKLRAYENAEHGGRMRVGGKLEFGVSIAGLGAPPLSEGDEEELSTRQSGNDRGRRHGIYMKILSRESGEEQQRREMDTSQTIADSRIRVLDAAHVRNVLALTREWR